MGSEFLVCAPTDCRLLVSPQQPNGFKMSRCPRTGNGPLVLLASLVRRDLPEDTDSLAGIAQGHGGVARGHEAAAPTHGQARRLAQLRNLARGEEQVGTLEWLRVGWADGNQ